MTAKDVIIVGSGLFGSIAATLARSRGHNVTVVSNLQPLAASKASGCVLAPSWLGSLDPAQVKRGMEVLSELYTVHDVSFETGILGTHFKAQRVDPDEVLVKPDVMQDVEAVRNGVVQLADGTTLKGEVLVAAGIWSEGLIDMPKIRGLYGSSVRFTTKMEVPRIHVYAPYRQSVGFQLNKKEVWFGDGTALIRKTWESSRDARIQKTLERGAEMINGHKGDVIRHRVQVGIRPYVEGHKSGYFDRPFRHTWCSTGGAKNGTILAAAQAARFCREAGL